MNIRSYEVIVDNLENNPHCLHGNLFPYSHILLNKCPTLLFKTNGNKSKEFYACSACRDRKICNFYLPIQEKNKCTTFWKEEQNKIVSSISDIKPYRKYIKILKLYTSKQSINDEEFMAGYCYTCSCLFTHDDSNKHADCKILSKLTYHQLTHPTEILIPKTENKTHAQYFFSESTVKDIALLLTRLKAKKLLCIGVPRIHEYFSNSLEKNIQSILLDLDKNYFHFYSRKQFIWYNMFNNYIFDKKQEKILYEFFKFGKIVVLLDPPFGGRVEPLERSLRMLNKTFAEANNNFYEGNLNLKVFWFFPYFMEQHITGSLPNFKMFDYKVNYENHSSFTDVGNKKRKFGSPVRIFTNVPLSSLDLSGISGYRFCKFCGHWVSNENKHCKECNTCTSKNGRTYSHCWKCSKCVKPSHAHCDTCRKCCLPTHVCGEFQPNPNCYHCHQPGHKKKNCPDLLDKKNGCAIQPDAPKKKRKVK